MKYGKFLYIVIVLQAILICYLMFTNFSDFDNKFESNVKANENVYSIYVEDDLFTFRDKEGRRLPTIEYNNNVYIPLSDKGLFLNYSVDVKDTNIYLKNNKNNISDYIDINCETVEGSTFTNDDFSLYDYTVIFNWSTWCPDCEDILKNLNGTLQQLKNDNVQFVGLLMDDVEEIKTLRDTVNIKLDKYDVDFINIIPNKEIENRLQTNIRSIPNFYIVNNKGKLVSEEIFNIKKLLENLKELKENDCNEC